MVQISIPKVKNTVILSSIICSCHLIFFNIDNIVKILITVAVGLLKGKKFQTFGNDPKKSIANSVDMC